MEEIRRSLELWAKGRVREELSFDTEYRLRKEELEVCWNRFREEQEGETVRAHIELVDLEAGIHEREGCAMFCLGLRVGIQAE